jgi:hypothetical protein
VCRGEAPADGRRRARPPRVLTDHVDDQVRVPREERWYDGEERVDALPRLEPADEQQPRRPRGRCRHRGRRRDAERNAGAALVRHRDVHLLLDRRADRVRRVGHSRGARDDVPLERDGRVEIRRPWPAGLARDHHERRRDADEDRHRARAQHAERFALPAVRLDDVERRTACRERFDGAVRRDRPAEDAVRPRQVGRDRHEVRRHAMDLEALARRPVLLGENVHLVAEAVERARELRRVTADAAEVRARRIRARHDADPQALVVRRPRRARRVAVRTGEPLEPLVVPRQGVEHRGLGTERRPERARRRAERIDHRPVDPRLRPPEDPQRDVQESLHRRARRLRVVVLEVRRRVAFERGAGGQAIERLEHPLDVDAR